MFETLLQFDEQDDGTEQIENLDQYYRDTIPCAAPFEVDETTLTGIGALN